MGPYKFDMATKKKFAIFAQMALDNVHILNILENLSPNSRITSHEGRLGHLPTKRAIWAHKNLVWPRKKKFAVFAQMAPEYDLKFAFFYNLPWLHIN